MKQTSSSNHPCLSTARLNTAASLRVISLALYLEKADQSTAGGLPSSTLGRNSARDSSISDVGERSFSSNRLCTLLDSDAGFLMPGYRDEGLLKLGDERD